MFFFDVILTQLNANKTKKQNKTKQNKTKGELICMEHQPMSLEMSEKHEEWEEDEENVAYIQEMDALKNPQQANQNMSPEFFTQNS